MGFSLTGTHIIYFIAAVIVAGTVSGVFVAVIQDVTNSFSDRGGRVEDQLDIEFKIINDPDNIQSSGNNYLFYIKNIGGKEISTSNQTFELFIDGEIIKITNYSFSTNILQIGETATLYININDIDAGNHKLRIVGSQAIDDEFTFKI